MERVTAEWLANADRAAAELADEQFPVETAFGPWGDDCRLAFAQAVARECEEVFRLNTHPDEFLANLRARFGLED